jgi:hypothetical protein
MRTKAQSENAQSENGCAENGQRTQTAYSA